MKLSNEAKIGIFVSVVLVMLFVLTIKSGDFHFGNKGYTVKAQFKSIDGVDINAPVMHNGFEVGRVVDVKMLNDNDKTIVELTLFLEEGTKIRSGAKAYIKNMGFMGEKYVAIVSGGEKNFLAANNLVIGQEPADLDKMLAEAQEIAVGINGHLKENKEAIDRIIANLDASMVSVKSITANVDERLTVNKGNIDETLASLKSASKNLDQLTYDLKQHPWKIMYRSKEKREESIKEMRK